MIPATMYFLFVHEQQKNWVRPLGNIAQSNAGFHHSNVDYCWSPRKGLPLEVPYMKSSHRYLQWLKDLSNRPYYILFPVHFEYFLQNFRFQNSCLQLFVKTDIRKVFHTKNLPRR